MKLYAQFNGIEGPVWLPVKEVVQFEQKWGGFSVVHLEDGQTRNVANERLQIR